VFPTGFLQDFQGLFDAITVSRIRNDCDHTSSLP
jgi:hypothetical protein